MSDKVKNCGATVNLSGNDAVEIIFQCALDEGHKGNHVLGKLKKKKGEEEPSSDGADRPS